MTYRDVVEQLYYSHIEKLQKGCIAFAHRKGSFDYYYAINGSQKGFSIDNLILVDVKNALSKLIKRDPKFCSFADSIIHIKPLSENECAILPELEEMVYNNFRLGKKQLYDFISIPQKPISSLPNRNWTCAERKIIGYFVANGIDVSKGIVLYSSRRPCYICIPSINHIIFMDSNKFYEMKLSAIRSLSNTGFISSKISMIK